MKDHDERTSELQSLLRGEISAQETYEKAIGEVGDQPGAQELRRISAQHSQAVNVLRERIVLEGETPDTDSGAWGAFARTVQGTANAFGDRSALKALKEGEEHGLKEYREALENKHTPAVLKDVIRDELLPRQEEHIRTLDALIDRK
jgi:uncharacterized protein (TIGR02284 family)